MYSFEVTSTGEDGSRTEVLNIEGKSFELAHLQVCERIIENEGRQLDDIKQVM